MSLLTNNSELQRPLKRSFESSFDESDFKNLPPRKRHQQLPPTPPTPSHSLDKASPPSCSRVESSTPAQSKSRLENWLEEVPQVLPVRANSCPPQLENNDQPKACDIGRGQQLSFDALQKMSQPQKQINRAISIRSSQSSQLNTSHTHYRKTLRNNGICIDHKGRKIPQELRSFLDSHILNERSSKLSAEEIDRVEDTVVNIAESPEANMYTLTNTALFPIERFPVGRGGNTPWHSDGLPRNEIYPSYLKAPKPDVHLGYLTDHQSDWRVEENAVIDHAVAKHLTQPTEENSFPFLVIELKSESKGGNLWQAENQAAGSGACCVNAMRWLFREAYPSQNSSLVDSIAFSACVTHHLVVFYVHFYLPEENQHYMSWIASCEPMRQVQKSYDLVESILEHCLGVRQTKVREALAKLYPFPDHWKNARLASEMDSQDPDVLSGEGTSSKSLRAD